MTGAGDAGARRASYAGVVGRTVLSKSIRSTVAAGFAFPIAAPAVAAAIITTGTTNFTNLIESSSNGSVLYVTEVSVKGGVGSVGRSRNFGQSSRHIVSVFHRQMADY
jgi:hypothetical protein